MHVHLILDLRFSRSLLLPLSLSLLIITTLMHDAKLAHSAADATALIAHPISSGRVSLSPASLQRDTLPLIICARARAIAVYIPAAIANAFYAPANIAGPIAWAR